MASTGTASITLDDVEVASTMSRSMLSASALARIPAGVPRLSFGTPIAKLEFHEVATTQDDSLVIAGNHIVIAGNSITIAANA